MSVYCHEVTGLVAEFAVKKYCLQGGITANYLAEAKEENKKYDVILCKRQCKGSCLAISCIFYFWKFFEDSSGV
jgi:hypothetical protein